MRFLVDANLPPRVEAELRDAGFDAVHVIDVGLASATDVEIIDRARAERSVVVTADTDFPMLMALQGATIPSVVLLRHVNELPPEGQARLLAANLVTVREDLGRGALVSLSPEHLRVRDLPIGRSDP